MLTQTRGHSALSSEQWNRRFNAVAAAQSRYLVTAGTTGLFYYSLYLSAADLISPETSIPGIGVKLSTTAVLLTAPAVIAFFLLATLGTVVALERAAGELGLSEPGEFEPIDLAPNLLDFAVYTTNTSRPLTRAVLALTYPVVFTVLWFEAAWFFVATWRIEETFHWYFAAISGAALLAMCIPRLLRQWRGSLRNAWYALREPHFPTSLRGALRAMAELERSLEAQGHKVMWNIREGSHELLVDGTSVLTDSSLLVLVQKARHRYAEGRSARSAAQPVASGRG